MEYVSLQHEFKPVYNAHSKLLILGSFPSVKSREQQFYYGHPQNRFWRIISTLFEEPLPMTIEEKKAMLYKYHIALWDVIESCDIKGSSDSSIKNVKPVALKPIIEASQITHIYTNGKLASKLYKKYLYPITQIEAIELPSSSPANARYTLPLLLQEWAVIKEKNKSPY